MNSNAPKENTRYRVGFDFNTAEDAVKFVRDIDADYFERNIGARLADGLDKRSVRTILVRSRKEVEGHPGALYPLPEPADGERTSDYREGLNHEQRAIFDAGSMEAVRNG